MKNVLCALIAVSVLFVTPANAGNNDDAAWFLGGVLGGFVLNDVLRPRPRPVYVYEEPQPVYRKVCNKIERSKWDRQLNRRVFWYERQCRYVPVY